MYYDTDNYWKTRGKGYLTEFQKRFNLLTRYRFWQQERVIRKTLPYKVETVLEVGCGFGRITKILLENPIVQYIEAIDISSDQIENAKKNIKDLRANFCVKSIFDLNYDSDFDLVVASEVLMHIPPDRIQDALERLHRAGKQVYHIDWYAPNEPKTVGGFCWQHEYPEPIIKKLDRQAIYLGHNTLQVR
jgi:2-polyprenyl-3-methyl-5-hydroxy-6-metoxy-1,4-benzoquinol methylase